MTITLSLLTFRNILTNYDNSAALNAARAYEARQPYSHLDSIIPSRILDVETGRLVASLDPHEDLFHVQIKTLPENYRDQWTPTAEYAVVHAINDWKNSAEARFEKSEAQRHRAMFDAAVIGEVNRRHRMIKAICSRIPIREQDVAAVFHACATEESLREMVAHWETALGTSIYELPQEIPAGPAPGNQQLPQAPEEPVPYLAEAPQDGDEGEGSI